MKKNNLFQATILSMQNEEAILQVKIAQLNFVPAFIAKMVGKWDKMCGYMLDPEQIILATLK